MDELERLRGLIRQVLERPTKEKNVKQGYSNAPGWHVLNIRKELLDELHAATETHNQGGGSA
jgi:hypothetical protein